MSEVETRDLLTRLYRAALEAMEGPKKAIAGARNTRAADSLLEICEEVAEAFRRMPEYDAESAWMAALERAATLDAMLSEVREGDLYARRRTALLAAVKRADAHAEQAEEAWLSLVEARGAMKPFRYDDSKRKGGVK